MSRECIASHFFDDIGNVCIVPGSHENFAPSLLVDSQASELLIGAGVIGNYTDDPLPVDILNDCNRGGLYWVFLRETGNSFTQIGFIVGKHREGMLEAIQFSVDPKFGAKGLGTWVLEVLTKFSKSKYSAIVLTTFRSVNWNEPFYKKNGFIEYDCKIHPDEWIKQKFDKEVGVNDTGKRVVLIKSVSVTPRM